ncbi:copper resistance protein B [Acinetobacter nectaris]|uniref:copper resistance protein B n=1 Tax=Acinetobacter nectaris TaxID=1219382 RepID=UPI001F3F0E98|nr:copper resistance protein B [Acinetobacter nectaris]MCF9000026.1 copper resistance protein B [Acinetobacter nectaris]MCF9028465.1 copper resistance protein B [Acinetobacter nectaris]
MHIIKAFQLLTVVSLVLAAMQTWAGDMEMMDHQHGGAIYQATTVDSEWLMNRRGEGQLNTGMKTWVGTDENKLFIEAEMNKDESERHAYQVSALYSRNVATFWDAQIGARYRDDLNKRENKSAIDGVVGLHGLAPYFFETEAYLYVGQDNYVALALNSNRDFLLTQKLITQPYINATVVISDKVGTAKKTGLSELATGIQTRYEITKNVMPFIDLAYKYDKGLKQTVWQSYTEAEEGFYYGAGLTFKF